MDTESSIPDWMMSAHEMMTAFQSTQNETFVPDKTIDKNTKSTDQELESLLKHKMQCLEQSLSVPAVKGPGSVGYIEWIQDKGLGLVIKKRPGPDQGLGFKGEDKEHYLYPEEVLAALELHEYYVSFQSNSLPMSLSDGYDLCLSSKEDKLVYVVYRDLRSKGYRVKRRRTEGDTLDTQVLTNESQTHESMKRHLVTKQSPSKKLKLNNGPLPTQRLTLDMTTDADNIHPSILGYWKDTSTDWQQYKKLKTGHNPESCSPSVSVKIDQEMDREIQPRLPSRSLYSNDFKPVLSFSTIETFEHVFKSLEEEGSCLSNIDCDMDTEHKKKPLLLIDYKGHGVNKGLIVVHDKTQCQPQSVPNQHSYDIVMHAFVEPETFVIKYFKMTQFNTHEPSSIFYTKQ